MHVLFEWTERSVDSNVFDVTCGQVMTLNVTKSQEPARENFLNLIKINNHLINSIIEKIIKSILDCT